MSLDGNGTFNAKNLSVLLYKDAFNKRAKEARVMVYALPHLNFKGATVCLGYRFFFDDDAEKRLSALVPTELRESVRPLVMEVEEFAAARNGYFIGGLVFLESDEFGRLYVHDPDTDGRVYLPALVAYYPRPVYTFEVIRMDQILLVDELHFRKRYDDVEGLAESIRKLGLLNPLVVFRDKKAYRLIAGYRRYYALKKLGWPHAPALVLNMPPETQNLVPLVENLFRVDPGKEEYKKLVNYILAGNSGYSSVYELLKALNIKDKKAVLDLLRRTGLKVDSKSVDELCGGGEGEEAELRALHLLVDRLLEEAERPIAPNGYDDEAIRLRIEALDESQTSVEAEAKDIRGDGDHGVEELDEGVGLIEIPIGLLKRLTAYLVASDAEDFRRKLVGLLENIVESPMVVLLKKYDGQVANQLWKLCHSSEGRLILLEQSGG